MWICYFVLSPELLQLLLCSASLWVWFDELVDCRLLVAFLYASVPMAVSLSHTATCLQPADYSVLVSQTRHCFRVNDNEIFGWKKK
jgi:hypothetical protein